MKTINGYIKLTRPPNLIIALFSIFIGGFVTGKIEPLEKLIMACFSGLFVMAGANSINDYFDREIDKINRPSRTIPAGLVTPNQAYVWSMALFLTGILLGLKVHLLGFGIALSSCLLLYLYSARLKRTVLFGNITVGFISGLAFVYGGLAVGRVGSAVIVGIFAFLFHLGREIIKDIEDMKGDEAEGAGTLPVRYGVHAAMICTTIVLICLILLTLVPYFLGIFNIYYLIVVCIGVNLFLVYVIISMWQNPSHAHLGKLAVFMKVDMLMGLLAIYIGN